MKIDADFDINALVERVCDKLWQAGKLEVVIRLGTFGSCRSLLRSLEIPVLDTASTGEEWKILAALLEQWQRPFLLILSNRFWNGDNAAAAVPHQYLPQSTNGHIILLKEYCGYRHAGRGWPRVRFNTSGWPNKNRKLWPNKKGLMPPKYLQYLSRLLGHEGRMQASRIYRSF